MSQLPALPLGPRKLPVQARSAASVDAILQASIQVLLAVGKERLTTTLVASRAGVSVGTLYQYFPNKAALLQAVLERHLDAVSEAVEQVCLSQRSQDLRTMGTALVTTFLAAKTHDIRTSVALYAVAADLDADTLVRRSAKRVIEAVQAMLASSSDRLGGDLHAISAILQGALAGVSRALLLAEAPALRFNALQDELIFFVCAYLLACSAREGDAGTAPD